MNTEIKSVIDQALSLSAEERAMLAEQLLNSLDCPDAELDKLWSEEAESRLEAYKNGEVQGIPAAEVLKKRQ